MLHVRSQKPLAAIEPALQRRGLNVLSLLHVGQLLPQTGAAPARDAVVSTVCRPDLSAALLAADLRFANFVPEGMVNARGSIPQRIDCKGTKVEDLAGTGQHDAQGG